MLAKSLQYPTLYYATYHSIRFDSESGSCLPCFCFWLLVLVGISSGLASELILGSLWKFNIRDASACCPLWTLIGVRIPLLFVSE